MPGNLCIYRMIHEKKGLLNRNFLQTFTSYTGFDILYDRTKTRDD